MLYKMAFQLSGKVVAIHLDNILVKAYLCSQGVTACPFLSRLACHICNLTDLHIVNFLSVYFLIHLNVEAEYLSQGRLSPEWHICSQIDHVAFQLWGQLEVNLLAFSHTIQCQHYYTLENSIPQGPLRLNALNHPGIFR